MGSSDVARASRSGRRSLASSGTSRGGAASEPLLSLEGGDARQGSGPLLPRGHLHLASEDVARIFFSTTARSSLQDHGKSHRMNVGRAVRDRANFQALSAGRGYERSSVPPLRREGVCTHNIHFGPQSLSNFTGDKEMKAINLRNAVDGSSSLGGPFEGETTYAKSYHRHDNKERGHSYKPEKVLHVDLASTLGEVSTAKRVYKLHSRENAERFRGETCKPPDTVGVVPDPKAFSFASRSAYDESHRRDFLRRSDFPHTCNPLHGGPDQTA